MYPTCANHSVSCNMKKERKKKTKDTKKLKPILALILFCKEACLDALYKIAWKGKMALRIDPSALLVLTHSTKNIGKNSTFSSFLQLK